MVRLVAALVLQKCVCTRKECCCEYASARLPQAAPGGRHRQAGRGTAQSSSAPALLPSVFHMCTASSRTVQQPRTMNQTGQQTGEQRSAPACPPGHRRLWSSQRQSTNHGSTTAHQLLRHVHHIAGHGAAAKGNEPNRAANRAADMRTSFSSMSTRSSRTVQHRQPLLSIMICALDGSSASSTAQEICNF